jgi:hypothetical protein
MPTGTEDRPMPFAIVDREKEGVDAILMIVDEQEEAETIVVELRRRDVRADLQNTEPERRRRGRR